jgi:hypothetical protein
MTSVWHSSRRGEPCPVGVVGGSTRPPEPRRVSDTHRGECLTLGPAHGAVSDEERKWRVGGSLRLAALASLSDGSRAPLRSSARLLSRYRQLDPGDDAVPRRPRLPPLPAPPRPRHPALRPHPPRLLPHGVALPRRRRGDERDAVLSLPLAEQPLRAGAQRAARAPRLPAPRALQLLGRRRRGSPRGDDRIHPQQPRPRGPRRPRRRLALEWANRRNRTFVPDRSHG